MNADQGANIVFILLALSLPLSALIARRVPLKRSLLMALAWIGIFVAMMIAITLVRRMSA